MKKSSTNCATSVKWDRPTTESRQIVALDEFITRVYPIDDVQGTFERVDANPESIKYPIDFRDEVCA